MEMLPATPESLVDMEDEASAKTGLGRNFSVGEQIPWKGIWFEIVELGYNRITLNPISETLKHHKKRIYRHG